MKRRKINFTKISANGNDFIVFDNRKNILDLNEREFFRDICRRRFSIGADGVILIEEKNHRIYVKFINSDGGVAGMCGNGGRAAAYYIAKMGIIKENTFEILADDGIHRVYIYDDTVKFQINQTSGEIKKVKISLKNEDFTGFLINTGVFH
ncbi:diaminopimelate epimerase, partial [candidate division KSB1 bacterium]